MLWKIIFNNFKLFFDLNPNNIFNLLEIFPKKTAYNNRKQASILREISTKSMKIVILVVNFLRNNSNLYPFKKILSNSYLTWTHSHFEFNVFVIYNSLCIRARHFKTLINFPVNPKWIQKIKKLKSFGAESPDLKKH